MDRKLYRDESQKKVAGVCAGLADHFGTEVSTMRLIFVLGLFLHGLSGLVYVILWIVLPGRNFGPKQPFVDYTVPPQQPYTNYNVPPQQAYTDYTVPPVPPMNPQPPRPVRNGPSTGAIVGGSIMVVIGVLILLKQFHILSIWHFMHFWPVSLIIVGVIFVISSFMGSSAPAEEVNDQDNSINDNPPTV